MKLLVTEDITRRKQRRELDGIDIEYVSCTIIYCFVLTTEGFEVRETTFESGIYPVSASCVASEGMKNVSYHVVFKRSSRAP